MIKLEIRKFMLDLTSSEQQELSLILNQPENILLRMVLLQFNEDGNLYLTEGELSKVILLLSGFQGLSDELKNKILNILKLKEEKEQNL